MMRRLFPMLLALLVAVGLGGTPAALGQGAEPAQPPPGWVSLGPVGPPEVRRIALSPDWPVDPFILVAGNYDLARSFDGGRTWTRLSRLADLPLRSPQVDVKVLGNPVLVRGSQEIVGFLPVSEGMGSWSLLRSVDLGTSWERVLTTDRPSYDPTTILSPSFDRDEVGLLHIGEQLFRTTDAGRTWRQVDFNSNQIVRQLVFSPSFLVDRTVYVSIDRTDEDVTRRDYDALPSNNVDNVTSRGILASTDAGDTWTQATEGMRVDGVPYRLVRRLSISPTYDADQTLFALALGPRDVNGSQRQRRAALFRSVDRGASWTSVYTPPEGLGLPPKGGRAPHVYAGSVSFSKRFTSDGVALLTLDTQHSYRNNRSCHVLRTTDHGRSWSVISAAFEYEEAQCRPAHLIDCGDANFLLQQRLLSGRVTLGVSEDLGTTWAVYAEPTALMAGAGELLHAPSGSWLVFGRSGVWLHVGPCSRLVGRPEIQG